MTDMQNDTPQHIADARRAYANAPHGYKLRSLYRLQREVTAQLKREAWKVGKNES